MRTTHEQQHGDDSGETHSVLRRHSVSPFDMSRLLRANVVHAAWQLARLRRVGDDRELGVLLPEVALMARMVATVVEVNEDGDRRQWQGCPSAPGAMLRARGVPNGIAHSAAKDALP